jgi:hypothetical protein
MSANEAVEEEMLRTGVEGGEEVYAENAAAAAEGEAETSSLSGRKATNRIGGKPTSMLM